MKTLYDPATDSLYIHLADHASVDSVELTDGLVVDYGLDGVAVGIDMQKGRSQVQVQHKGKFIG
jgi:uncharacterized protein YuzE